MTLKGVIPPAPSGRITQEPVWLLSDLSGLAEVFDGTDTGDRRRAEDQDRAA